MAPQYSILVYTAGGTLTAICTDFLSVAVNRTVNSVDVAQFEGSAQLPAQAVAGVALWKVQVPSTAWLTTGVNAPAAASMAAILRVSEVETVDVFIGREEFGYFLMWRWGER